MGVKGSSEVRVMELIQQAISNCPSNVMHPFYWSDFAVFTRVFFVESFDCSICNYYVQLDCENEVASLINASDLIK